MNLSFPRWLSFLCLCLLPIPALGQCQDQPCHNLQYILYAAQTDFREFRAMKTPGPDMTVGAAKVPCQMSAWANNVPMYICYAQVPFADGEEWYTKTLAAAQKLQYLWHFKIDSPASDHFVEGGMPGCEVPPADGPYLWQCPLHFQAVKQADGTIKLYLWLNSYSSPYLVPKPPPPPPKSPPPAAKSSPQNSRGY
jgi:hypothetical protein